MQGNDLQSITKKLVEFLLKKNLFDEFKKQHAQQKAILNSLAQQPPKRKKKKSSKRKSEQPVECEEQEEIEQTVQEQPKYMSDPRWLEPVEMFEELTKGSIMLYSDQYYLFEGAYYKLKSAKATRFQCSFRLDAINVLTSKREEVFVSSNKQVFWVSTLKLEVEKEEERFIVRPENAAQPLPIENQQHLQLINKYWSKVKFFAVLPTNRQRQPLAEIIFIEFIESDD